MRYRLIAQLRSDTEMEGKVINQKEYLKKYLSSGDGGEKKKKKKKKLKVGSKTVKIIDDDIDLKNMRPIADNEFEIFIDAEDAPQIAGVVDEQGPVDFSDKKRWKIIADNEGGDLTITSNDREDRIMNNKGNSQPTRSIDDSDEDLSPPRRQQKYSDDDLSPPRISKKKKKREKSKRAEKERKNEDSDISPPRRPKTDKSSRSKYHGKSVQTSSDTDSEANIRSRKSKKSRRKEKTYDSDLSPPRNRKNDDSDLSPPRKKKNDDSDLSPPRKKKNNDSDLSPPRKPRHAESKHITKYQDAPSGSSKYNKKDSDSDLSPPRRVKHDSRQITKHNNMVAGPSKSSRRNSDSDLSPPRKRKEIYDSDLSPPRRKKIPENTNVNFARRDKNDDSDLSPPRRQKDHKNSYKSYNKDSRNYKYSDSKKSDKRYDADLSPLRKRDRECDRNQSPPSKSREYSKEYYERSRKDRRKDKHERDSEHRSNSHHKRETHDYEERHENRMKKTLDGKTAGLQDAKALREETQAHKKREAEQFSKLSKEVSGVGQAAIIRDPKTGRKRNLEAEAAEEREKQKRQSELDEKYAKWGKGLKQVEDREEKLKDDLYEMSKPLARYADDVDLDKRLREQEREGDPMLEYIKQKQIKEGKRKPDQPKYEGSFMPNRFGIKPGHRWDGVDRSNGYEKRWFESQNAKKAIQEEAYKWSTSDM